MRADTLLNKKEALKTPSGTLLGVFSMLLALALVTASASGAIELRDLVVTAGALIAFSALSYSAGRSERQLFRLLAALPLLCFAAVSCYAVVQLLSLGELTWFSESAGLLHLFGVAWLLALAFAFYALTGSLGFSVSALWSVSLVFGITNYTLQLYRGRPFLLIDLASIKTAMSVTDSYEFTVTPLFVTAAVLAVSSLGVMLWLCRLSRVPGRRPVRWGLRLLTAAAAAWYVWACLFTYMFAYSGIFINWDENEFEASSVMYFVVTAEKLNVAEPEGYSDEALDAIAEETPTNASNGVKPDIIVVMSEAFSDVSAIADFETNIDVTPFFDSLKGAENTITGTVYSSVFGGNTANSEYEFLTGDTMAFIPTGSVPYMLYVNYETDTLVSTLEAQGYTSTALHPYLASGWNRPSVYELYGFDEVYFKDDFENRSYLRNYVTDESDYENLIRWYEERPEDEQVFMFNITMQNHGSYTFEDFEPTVTVTGHESAFPLAEQYLSLINITDSATRGLLEYFSNVDEPVILLFFGDHQPRLDDGFYDLLYGHDATQLTVEELEREYAVPFCIWANYDINGYDAGELSINRLSSLLLEAAGLEETTYQSFLSELSGSWPVVNANGAMDAEGTWHGLHDPVFIGDEGIMNYRILQYNHLFDPAGVRSDIFALN